MRMLPLLVVMALYSCSDDPASPDSEGVDTPASADMPDAPASRPETYAKVITTPEELIGGLKADGQLGDFTLYNGHVRFVIEGLRPTSGYRYRGGHVVDADIVRPEGEVGADRFGEMIFTWNLQILYPESIEILSDGSDGEAHVRVVGRTGEFYWATQNSFLSDFEISDADLEIVYDYRLGSDDTALRLTRKVRNLAQETVSLDFNIVISNHGDGAFPWTPSRGFGSATDGAYIGVSGRSLAYAVIPVGWSFSSLLDYNTISIYMQDPLTLDPGESAISELRYVVTVRGPDGLDRALRELVSFEPEGGVKGSVALPATALPSQAWVAAWAGAQPVTLGPVDDEGGFDLALPPGEYEVAAYARHHGPGLRIPVTVAVDETQEVALTVPAAAKVIVHLSDGEGEPVSGRVTFTLAEKDESPLPPTKVDPWSRVGLSKKTVATAYAVGGSAETHLPAGSYHVLASHGFAWELDTADITVSAGESRTVELTLIRAVDTTGWISADFHLHGYRSWDSSVPYGDRLVEAIADDLDLPIMTEHVWASGLGAHQAIAHIVGQEVTHLEYGHFNVFPLVPDATQPNNGGIFPLDKEPPALFEAMRAQNPAPEIIQINHPRNTTIGGFFAHVELDPETLEVARPDEWTTDFDAVEVYNARCAGADNEDALVDWIGLTNHGLKTALSSGSDSHDLGTPPGFPRNWIQADLAALQADPQVLVDAVKARRMVVSCGPFVRFTASGDVGLGGLASVDEKGEVQLFIRVEAPTWMSVDVVEILENGLVIDALVPDGSDPVVRLDTALTLQPVADAWYVVRVSGSEGPDALIWPGAPFAMTNPIEVDADRDGTWTPPATLSGP